MYKPLDITTCTAAFCFYSSSLSSGGAVVSTAPTKQELLQYSSVGALGTSAPPESTFLKASRFPSDSVRRPIGFRPPSDQIPSAARSDSVRRPIGFRPPSDRIPSAVRSDILKRNQPSTEHLH